MTPVRPKKFLAGLLFLTSATITGCAEQPPGSSQSGTSPDAEKQGEGEHAVTALIAASTGTAVEEIAARFEQQTGATVKLSPGPSNGLANQILAGAPADIYISANQKWAKVVEKSALAAESRPLMHNALVLVVPRNNPAGVSRPQDLLAADVQRIALAGEKVPAGIYADQALAALDLAAPLRQAGKIVRGEDVRITLSYVARAEAEAGIVYATDARLSDDVRTVWTFAAETHEPIVYPALLLKQGAQRKVSREFYRFLQSAEAAAIFREHGFSPQTK